MSVINDMLRDLDKRNASIDADDGALMGLTPVAEANPSSRKFLGGAILGMISLVLGLTWFLYSFEIKSVLNLANKEPVVSESESSVSVDYQEITPSVINSVISYGVKQSKNSTDLSLVLNKAVQPFIAQSEHGLELLLLNVKLPYTWPQQQLNVPFKYLTAHQKGQDLVINVNGFRPIAFKNLSRNKSIEDSDGNVELHFSFVVDDAVEPSKQEVVDIERKSKDIIDREAALIQSFSKIQTEEVSVTQARVDVAELTSVESSEELVDSSTIIKPLSGSAKKKTEAKLVISSNDVVNKAKKLYQDGKAQEAMSILVEPLSDTYPDTRLVEIAATIYIATQDYIGAQNIIAKGLLTDANNLVLLELLSRSYLAQGKADKALSVLEGQKVRLRDHTSYGALLAAAYQAKGDYQKAAATYRMLLQVVPGDGQWLLGFAINNEYLKANDKAVKAYKLALRSGQLTDTSHQFVTQRLAVLATR